MFDEMQRQWFLRKAEVVDKARCHMDELNKCTKCGKRLEEKWAYCPWCGSNTGVRKLTQGKWHIERYLSNELPAGRFARHAIHAYKIWASPPESHTKLEIAKCVWRETDAQAISYLPDMIRFIKNHCPPLDINHQVHDDVYQMLAFLNVTLEDEV